MSRHCQRPILAPNLAARFGLGLVVMLWLAACGPGETHPGVVDYLLGEPVSMRLYSEDLAHEYRIPEDVRGYQASLLPHC